MIYVTALQGLATLIVAIFGLTIARRNAATARTKLRLDLYEKRFAVYQAVINYIDAATTGANLNLEQIS
jgi:hypothetical protein